MSTQVLSPFPFFTTRDGKALNLGYVYIGQPNADPEISPKAAFWDNPLTVPATQPLRTDAGYIVNSGDPAQSYTDGAFSVRVRANNGGIPGSQVFYRAYVPDAEAFARELEADLASNLAGKGASMVGKEGSGTVQDHIDYADPILDTADTYLDQFYDAAPVITCGSGGNFSTLVAALDFLKFHPLNRPLELVLLNVNTPDTDAGDMAIPSTGYIFDNPNSRNLVIRGAAFSGGQGTISNSDMTGTKATDLAFIKTKYPASIRLNGADDLNGTYGLAFPYGLRSMSRIFFEGHGRYTLDFGYNGAHSSAVGNSGTVFNDCAWLGGVWGVLGYGAQLTFNGTNFFGYQIGGGPIGLFDSGIETDGNILNLYSPNIAAYANSPKYAIYADGSYLALNPLAQINKINIYGQFLHGLYAVNGSHGVFLAANFNRVTQPFTIGDSTVDAGTGTTITAANPANTALTTGGEQPGVPGNAGLGALMSIGPGGMLKMNGCAISNCIAAFYIFSQGGQFASYGSIAISGSKATTAAFRWTACKGNVCSAAITTPQGGSLDQSVALQNGDVFWYANSGITFSPALNTPTAGSGNYN